MPPKVLIVHDMFLYRAGGERLMLLMARALDADILTGFYHAASYDPASLGVDPSRIRCLLDAPPASSSARKILLDRIFRTKTAEIMRGYDVVIFSGDCLSAADSLRPGQRAIYYCHTPPRHLFDQRAAYLAKVRWFLRPVYAFAFWIFRRAYLRDLAKIPTALVNSRTILERLETYSGREGEIVYPCVDTDFFSPAEPSADTPPYYLSYARLAGIKRVDRVVRAFRGMPGRRLVVVHGPTDPQRAEVMELARGAENISFVQSPSDTELRELIRGATATLYVPHAEDFGMTPLESMACGTPVIGADEGGLRETVLHGRTGLLVGGGVTPADIAEAVEKLEPVAASMREACVARAAEFGYDAFAAHIREVVNRADAGK